MFHHIFRRTRQLATLTGAALLVAACTISPVTREGAGTSTGAAAQPTVAPPAGEAVLSWTGNVEVGDGDPATCKELRVNAAGQVQFGMCGEQLATADAPRPEFVELAALVAPFELSTDSEQIVFRGTGEADSTAWQQAVLQWARDTYGEAFSRRACASCRTAASWDLGELTSEAGVCARLTVLNYGYAQAETRPCDGGDVIGSVGDWLTTEEWGALSRIITGRATSYAGENNASYINGTGNDDMSEAELADLAAFMQDVYDRLNAE